MPLLFPNSSLLVLYLWNEIQICTLSFNHCKRTRLSNCSLEWGSKKLKRLSVSKTLLEVLNKCDFTLLFHPSSFSKSHVIMTLWGRSDTGVRLVASVTRVATSFFRNEPTSQKSTRLRHTLHLRDYKPSSLQAQEEAQETPQKWKLNSPEELVCQQS